MFSKTFITKWSDIDLNGHMGNVAYCAYATNVRFMLFTEYGFNLDPMGGHPIGPIVFKEEITYYREVKIGELITVTCEVSGLSKDYKKFSFIQKIYKADQVLAAKVVIDGAWFDVKIRKAVIPPKSLVKVIETLPRMDQFQWINANN